MLYDPKWEVKTKADPFSLVAFIAWLETRDPAESYDYCDPRNCLLCRYFSAHGFEHPRVALNYVSGTEFPDQFRLLSHGGGSQYGWNVGAALKRARAIAR